MNRSGCNWNNSFPTMKLQLWDRLDDMDHIVVEQAQPSRVSSRRSSTSRDHGAAVHFTRSGVTCLVALTLVLLSVTLYLDRTLERNFVWQNHTTQCQQLQGSALSIESAVENVEEVTINRLSIDVQDNSFGNKLRVGDGALFGMGMTFRKGSRAMSELVVAHLQDTTTPTEFRLFLRTLHRSGVTGRADIVFLFPSLSSSAHLVDDNTDGNQLTRILTEEEESFWRIMRQQHFPAPAHDHGARKTSKKLSTKRSSSSNNVANESSVFMLPNSSIGVLNLTGHPSGGLTAPHGKKTMQSKRSDHGTKSSPSDAIHSTLNAAAIVVDRKDSKKWNHTILGPSQIMHGTLTHETADSEGRDSDKENSRRLSTAHINSSPSENSPGSTVLSTRKPICPFNFLAFWESRKEGIPGKGRQLRDRIMWKTDKQDLHHGSGSTSTVDEDMTLSVKWGDWGSIAGFEMQDLEQDEAIAGFIDNPPSQLRRWMCYKMLLGMVKRQYRTVILTEVSQVFIMGDIMAPTRDPSFGSSVYLFSEDRTWNESYEASRSRDSDKLRNGHHLLSTNDHEKMVEFTEASQTGSDGSGRQKLAFILDVYGKEIWKKLEEEDMQRVVLNSGIIIGNMKSIQALSNAMVTEIVRVAAILRKSREPFHDEPLLNYVVQKSGVLNRKVAEKVSILSSRTSFVHTLPGSTQKFLFMREEGSMFHALQGLHHELVPEERRKVVIESIHADICSSQGRVRVYEDCPPET
ncbi:unnamed protein product [Calypogeia fissa]